MKLLYPVIDNHKECGRCHIIKPVSEFSLRSKSNKDGSFASQTNCKECDRAAAIKYNRLNGFKPTKRYPIINDHKRCTACNEHKHVSEYDVKKNGKIVAKCKPCQKEYVRKHNLKRERIEYAKNFHKNNRNPDKIKAYTNFQRDNLTDYYIRSIITRQNDLKSKDVPAELIEIKRKQLSLSRQIKQLKQL
jgi:hypothetical protein